MTGLDGCLRRIGFEDVDGFNDYLVRPRRRAALINTRFIEFEALGVTASWDAPIEPADDRGGVGGAPSVPLFVHGADGALLSWSGSAP